MGTRTRPSFNLYVYCLSHSLYALDVHVDKLLLISSAVVQLGFEVQNRKLLTIQTASVNVWWEIGIETSRCELMDVAEPQYNG